MLTQGNNSQQRGLVQHVRSQLYISEDISTSSNFHNIMGAPEEDEMLGLPVIIHKKDGYHKGKLEFFRYYKAAHVLNIIFMMVIIALVVGIITMGATRPTSSNENKDSEKMAGLYTTNDEAENKHNKSAPCEDDWIWYRGKCYNFSTKRDTWMNSQTFCKLQEASLVNINNQEELEFLFRYKGKENHWIGLRRTDDNTAWIWTNGTLYNENLFKIGRSLQENIEYVYLNHKGVRSQEETTDSYWICEKP
ncbi:early activation antigen CD69-like isoform X2 [Hyla sarda]|uniref:early activation antigen CD69-like isoform X2 n=1 Tax=Hyla sarda TaxID=327740 RepID=UPI0024C3E745|nr:early activation antigen CD69-like isoform X2 [Hyla sarda]